MSAPGLWWIWASGFAAALLAFVVVVRLLHAKTGAWRGQFVSGVGQQLDQAFVFIDPRRLFSLNLVVVVGVTVGAWLLTHSILLAAACAAATGALPRLTLWWLRRQRMARIRGQLPDALLLIAGGLRSGSSLSQAIAMMLGEMPAPVGDEFGLFLREQRLGRSFDDALAGLEQRVPIEETRLLGAALRIAHETGGNLAETLEQLADALRSKLQIEGKIDALTSQGRLQGWVMGLLPMALALVLLQIDHDAMLPLFTTWYGWVTCGVVLLLEAVGVWMIRRIVDIDV